MGSLLLCLLAMVGSLDGIVSSAVRPPDRLGAIILQGNMYTDEPSIRKVLALIPGQQLPSEGQLLGVEIRMLKEFGERFKLTGDEGPLLRLQRSKFDTHTAISWSFFPNGGIRKPKRSCSNSSNR